MSSDTSADEVTQKDLSGDARYKYGGGWEFTATVDCEDFRSYVESVAALTDDARMTFTPEKIFTSAVDPASVAIVENAEVELSESSGHLKAGVNFHKLEKELPAYYPGDEYEIVVESDSDGTTIRVWNMEGEVELNATDPETIRTCDPPDLDELDQEFQMDAFKVTGVLGKTAEASSQAIRVTPKYGELLVEGTDGESWSRSWSVGADCEASGPSKYSPDYMADVCSALPLDQTITVKIGEEYPIVLEADSVKYILAPRIGDRDP